MIGPSEVLVVDVGDAVLLPIEPIFVCFDVALELIILVASLIEKLSVKLVVNKVRTCAAVCSLVISLDWVT